MPGKHAKEQQVRRGFTGPVASAAVVAALLLGGAAGAVKLSQERTGAVVRADPSTTATALHAPAGDASSRAQASPAAPSPSPAAPSPSASPTATPERASRGSTRTAKPSPTATKKSTVVETGSCGASFYDEPQGTANGETFDPEALTAAHKEWAFDTRVRVTNPDNGKAVTVRINDRGPYIDGRCIDLSRAAFRAIADLDLGAIDVTYEVLK